MDKKYHIQQAMKFAKEGSCYIHVEMKDGKAGQLVGGDGKALIHCLSKIIERISVQSGTTFTTTIASIKAWHDLCEEEKMKEDIKNDKIYN